MKQTAVEWLFLMLNNPNRDQEFANKLLLKALEMEKQQVGYTKEDVLKAGEIGEINHYDYKHIVSLLDEAKEYNNKFKSLYKVI